MKSNNFNEIAEYALNLGFQTEWSPRFGYSFKNSHIRVWCIRGGWQCADLIDGYYQNHRPGKSLKEVLERESKGGSK